MQDFWALNGNFAKIATDQTYLRTWKMTIYRQRNLLRNFSITNIHIFQASWNLICPCKRLQLYFTNNFNSCLFIQALEHESFEFILFPLKKIILRKDTEWSFPRHKCFSFNKCDHIQGWTGLSCTKNDHLTLNSDSGRLGEM